MKESDHRRKPARTASSAPSDHHNARLHGPHHRRASRSTRNLALAGLLALAAVSSGCLGVRAREATLHKALRDHADRVETKLTVAPSTKKLLSARGLSIHHPEESAYRLEAEASAHPDPAVPLALAELWYHVGLKRCGDPFEGLNAFRNAAAAAAIALHEPNGPDVEHAVEIHNDAVARLLRIIDEESRRLGTGRKELGEGAGIRFASEDSWLDDARITRLEPSEDYTIRGLRTMYGRKGLGVTAVGLRPADRANPREPTEVYYPPRLRVAATVVAVPNGDASGEVWRTAPLTLMLHDPFRVRELPAGGRTYRLAYDTSTPLALQVAQSPLSAATWAGLFMSDFQNAIEPGLYMLRPYQPGKIPVVFVHGLNSNPAAFVQMLNDLRNDPAVIDRYQFLFFAYPTGRAIPISADRLRKSLYDAESRFGSDPAFHKMVLIGHSMGGNLSRYMVTDSGRQVWDSVFRVPPEQFKASPEIHKLMTDALIFRPVPFVRRAIFIAAPHRGSPVSDEPFGRIVSRFLRPPADQTAFIAEVTSLNGPDVFHENVFRRRSTNSIANLSTRSPVLLSVSDLPISPSVRAHSIIFDFMGVFPTDLVVHKKSSSIPQVESQTVFPGTHFSEQSRKAVAEVRRLLLDGIEMSVAPVEVPAVP